MEFQLSMLVRHESSLMNSLMELSVLINNFNLRRFPREHKKHSQGMPGYLYNNIAMNMQMDVLMQNSSTNHRNSQKDCAYIGGHPERHSVSASLSFHSMCCYLLVLFPLYKQYQAIEPQQLARRIKHLITTQTKAKLTILDSSQISSPQVLCTGVGYGQRCTF